MIKIPKLTEFMKRTEFLIDFEFEDVDIEADSASGVFLMTVTRNL